MLKRIIESINEDAQDLNNESLPENDTDDDDVIDVTYFDLVSNVLADTWPGDSLNSENDAENSYTKEDCEDRNRCVVDPFIIPL